MAKQFKRQSLQLRTTHSHQGRRSSSARPRSSSPLESMVRLTILYPFLLLASLDSGRSNLGWLRLIYVDLIQGIGTGSGEYSAQDASNLEDTGRVWFFIFFVPLFLIQSVSFSPCSLRIA